jgi:type IV pilus assembly protein PilP
MRLLPRRNSSTLRWCRFSMFSLLCPMLAACSRNDDMADLQQFVIDVSMRQGEPVEPMPVFLPYEAFTYSAASMRGPFDVPVMAGTAVGVESSSTVQPDVNRTPEPLESFALTALSMVGMISRGDVYIALIRHDLGTIHRIGSGNYLGRNHGRVVQVWPEEVSIVEIVPSGDGGWVERPRTLALVR